MVTSAFPTGISELDQLTISFVGTRGEIALSQVNKQFYMMLSNSDHFKTLFEKHCPHFMTALENADPLSWRFTVFCETYPKNCWKILCSIVDRGMKVPHFRDSFLEEGSKRRIIILEKNLKQHMKEQSQWIDSLSDLGEETAQELYANFTSIVQTEIEGLSSEGVKKERQILTTFFDQIFKKNFEGLSDFWEKDPKKRHTLVSELRMLFSKDPIDNEHLVELMKTENLSETLPVDLVTKVFEIMIDLYASQSMEKITLQGCHDKIKRLQKAFPISKAIQVVKKSLFQTIQIYHKTDPELNFRNLLQAWLDDPNQENYSMLASELRKILSEDPVENEQLYQYLTFPINEKYDENFLTFFDLIYEIMIDLYASQPIKNITLRGCQEKIQRFSQVWCISEKQQIENDLLNRVQAFHNVDLKATSKVP
jgi:hypothetical protein